MTALSTALDGRQETTMSDGGIRTLGLATALAAMVLAAASLSTGSPAAGDWVRAGLVVAWAAAGLVLVTRGLLRLGVVAAGAALTGGICAVTDSSADAVHVLAASLIPAVALHLEIVMPTGRVGRPTERNLVIAGYLVAASVGAGLAIGGRRPAVAVVVICLVSALLAGLHSAHRTYRLSTGRDRQRLQLIGCAVAIIVEVGLVLAALRLLIDRPPHAAEVAAASSALVPLALAAGTSSRISRRVDRVLVHTVSATGLTAVVVVVYLVIVIGLGRVPADTERTLLILSMVAAAVAALAYVPARERLADMANRLVYGERHPPDEVLRSWGSRLSRAIPMDELLLQLAESLRKVMALRRAEIWTGTAGHLDLAVSVPDRTARSLALSNEEQPVVTRAGVVGNAWLEVWLPALLDGRDRSRLRVASASHNGKLLGLLVVERADDGDSFTEEDDRVLAELARQVGLALHNVQLDSALQESLVNLERANEDLQASRLRIVATADAERRKIERNLHDGAQQHLVALAVNLRLAKDMLVDDPESAAEMLEALGDAVKDTIHELRDLAHGIYPPLLVDSGLSQALRAAANRSPLSVRVDTEGVGRHPSEVEAAVYFCCLEALQNAAKHAPEAAVEIIVGQDETRLRFEVRDDGPGFDVATAIAGHGFVNMSDRLGAMGGTVEWRSAPGVGAVITGEIPL